MVEREIVLHIEFEQEDKDPFEPPAIAVLEEFGPYTKKYQELFEKRKEIRNAAENGSGMA